MIYNYKIESYDLRTARARVRELLYGQSLSSINKISRGLQERYGYDRLTLRHPIKSLRQWFRRRRSLRLRAELYRRWYSGCQAWVRVNGRYQRCGATIERTTRCSEHLDGYIPESARR